MKLSYVVQKCSIISCFQCIWSNFKRSPKIEIVSDLEEWQRFWKIEPASFKKKYENGFVLVNNLEILGHLPQVCIVREQLTPGLCRLVEDAQEYRNSSLNESILIFFLKRGRFNLSESLPFLKIRHDFDFWRPFKVGPNILKTWNYRTLLDHGVYLAKKSMK